MCCEKVERPETDYTRMWRAAQTVVEIAPRLLKEVRRYLEALGKI